MHALIRVPLKFQGGPSTDLWGAKCSSFLSRIPHSSHCGPRALAASVSLDAQVKEASRSHLGCPSSHHRLQTFSRKPAGAITVLDFLFSCLSGDHCVLLLDAQCLENDFSISLASFCFLACFRWEGEPCYSILSGSRSYASQYLI